MYEPTTGRWSTVDPSGFEAGDPDLYRFVGNNPTNLTDPTGLQPGLGCPAPDQRVGEDKVVDEVDDGKMNSFKIHCYHGAFFYGELNMTVDGKSDTTLFGKCLYNPALNYWVYGYGKSGSTDPKNGEFTSIRWFNLMPAGSTKEERAMVANDLDKRIKEVLKAGFKTAKEEEQAIRKTLEKNLSLIANEGKEMDLLEYEWPERKVERYWLTGGGEWKVDKDDPFIMNIPK